LLSGAPLLRETVHTRNSRAEVLRAVERVNALLTDARVVVPGMTDLEVSHHYGMERFGEFGLTMITVVNRAYCKKILVMLPGQTHPEQYHEQKEETFVLLHGSMTLWLDGVERTVESGDVVTVTRGVRHKFFTRSGVVFEEISSTHIANDSYYTDETIARNRARKTLLTHWLKPRLPPDPPSSRST
jgi:N-acetylneuraminate synthase